jgi:P27 family predicted phage terminase small subunit
MSGTNDTGAAIAQPDWRQLLKDPLEIETATDHWTRITDEMGERQILAASNGHAIQRLVLSYLLFDRCSREIAKGGAVLKPKRGSTKSIARLSPHFTAMRAASAEAERLEAQLGLSTLRRSRAGKVTKRRERRAGADAFLGPRES